MTLIHILDHKTDQIIQTLENKQDTQLFWNDQHTQTIKNEEVFDFTTQYNNSENISGRNRVVIPTEDGFFREFLISQTVKHKETKEVYTSASYLDLKKQKVIEPGVYDGYTVQMAADLVITGTEWERGVIESDGVRKVEFENYTNPYDALKKIASTFEVELRFRIEIQDHRIVGRFVDFIKKLGEYRGKEIEFGKDLIGVKRIEKSDQIVSALLVLGPEKEDGTRLTVEVKNEDARERWSRTGEHMWDTYEPQTDNQDITVERLTTLGEMELNKRINSAVQYVADQASIEHIFGYEHEKVRLGDISRIKDTSYSPALYLEARVISVTRSLSDKSKKKFILGDFIEYNEEDIKATFQALKKTIAKKVSEQKLLETTYTQTQIDSKDSIVVSEAAKDASEKAGTAKAEAIESAATDATNKANAAKDEAVGIAEEDATRKANAAEEAANSYTDNKLTNYVEVTLYDQDLESIQAQIDNQIQTHFYDHEPTLDNLPASEWTTVELKNQHIGDLYYNSTTGYSYRFMLDGSDYKWVLVRDEGIAKALQDASQAQDTADSKRRVFVSQPTTPYDVGDLWDNNGAVYRSNVTKTQSASFSPADWVKIGDVTSKNTSKDTENVGGTPAETVRDNAVNSVQQEKQYNGTSISEEEGFKVVRSDTLVQVLMNATEGFLIQKRVTVNDPWVNMLYIDTNGNAKYAGDIEGSTIMGSLFKGVGRITSEFGEEIDVELILDPKSLIFKRTRVSDGSDLGDIILNAEGLTVVDTTINEDYVRVGGPANTFFSLGHADIGLEGYDTPEGIFRWQIAGTLLQLISDKEILVKADKEIRIDSVQDVNITSSTGKVNVGKGAWQGTSIYSGVTIVSDSAYPPATRKEANGVVRMRGLLKPNPSSKNLFLLPADRRPTYAKFLDALAYMGGTTYKTTNIIVNTNGVVTVEDTAANWVSLDGKTFELD